MEQQTKVTILVAEDNIVNQEVVIDMLEVIGYTADIANNGEEAVEMCKNKQYDIVLMDCHMPVIDGFNATRMLRDIEKTKKYKQVIIALTGNALLGDKEKCLDAGMDDFLSKPFSYEQLKTILSLHIK